jgi:adenylate cyclase, class 2
MIRSHPLYPTELQAHTGPPFIIRVRKSIMHGETETEVKIPVADESSIPSRFSHAGLTVSVPRLFESNTVYDTDDLSLEASGMLLRLRQVGEKGILTWKGPTSETGQHKNRAELETTVGSIETLSRILEQLGFKPVFRYEKYRTEFRRAGGPDGVVTFDETPIGTFLEIEGPGEWIDRMASELGFTPKDYVVESYGKLYLADCARRGVKPSHMVFTS